MARGLVVGAGVLAFTAGFVELRLEAPLWALAFALLGAGCSARSACWRHGFGENRPARRVQNFAILPLTMLSGVFYSIHSLPAFWREISHANPFFYMIDGFRYGFFGASDVAPATSLGGGGPRRGGDGVPFAAQIRLQAENLRWSLPKA